MRWLVRVCEQHSLPHGSLHRVHRVAEDLAPSSHSLKPIAPALHRMMLPQNLSSSLPYLCCPRSHCLM